MPKLSDVIMEVLNEDERYKDFNKAEKLLARSTIKATLGGQDDEVDEANVNELKTQLAFMFSSMPIFTTEQPKD